MQDLGRWMFVQDHYDGSCRLISCVEDHSKALETRANLAAAVSELRRSPKRFAGMIVRARGLGPLDEILDELCKFRSDVPGCPLVLISRELSSFKLKTSNATVADMIIDEDEDLRALVFAMEASLAHKELAQRPVNKTAAR